MFPTSSSISITPTSIWILCSIVVVLWAIMTGILMYHWKTYGVDPKKSAWMKYTYLVGSSFFLIIVFLSAVTFSLQ